MPFSRFDGKDLDHRLDASDAERVVAFPTLSLASGAVKGWDRRNPYTFSLLEAVAAQLRANLGDVFIGVNSLLQGKVGDAVTDWARFGFNSTVGLFGINDVASEMRLEKHNEDFGQTFGVWGIPPVPYVVLPFLGPSSPRDAVGRVAEARADLDHAMASSRGGSDDRYARAAVLLMEGKPADLLETDMIKKAYLGL